MNDDLTARLRDAEEALRGLHRRLLEAEGELDDARRLLAIETEARRKAEARLAERTRTIAMRVLRAIGKGR